MTQQFIIQGRIVWGHPGKARDKKDVRTKQPVLNSDGSKKQQYTFGIAVDKKTFNEQVWPMLYNEARSAFPNGIPANFAYKFKDGDAVDSKGQPYSAREGYAGHCVINISTEGFAPPLFKQGPNGYVQIGAEEIKCGDFVAVSVNIKYNGAVSPNTPGIYVNPQAIVFLGYGQEIVSAGQDPDELFAGFQAQQFHGMSATPVMGNAPLPAGMVPGAQPAAAPAYGAPPAAPAYGAPPATAPAQLPPPHHQFVHNATGQAPAAPAPAYGAPPAAPVAGYTPVAAPAYGAAPAAPAYGAPPAGTPPYPGAPVGR